MATRITAEGRLTVPRRVREALRLSEGDVVEFLLNANGEFVLRKAPPASQPEERQHGEREHPRLDAQMRRRAEELLALLRGLD